MNTGELALRIHRSETWQEQLQGAIRTPQDLAAAVGLPLDALPHSGAADAAFPLLVPQAFASRMEKGNAEDPLLRQVLAADEETAEVAGFSSDPVEETSLYAGSPGVIQKYRGRALLIATGHCAINCRYCFRRSYPYSDNAQSTADRRVAIDRLLEDPEIHELILSGGDPLLLPDHNLAAIAQRIHQQNRQVTLRIHTRLPIVIPDRVTDSLIQALVPSHIPVVVIIHCNHPNEIDEETSQALRRLRNAGITVLNQSVILRGVNDDAQVLGDLSDRLFAAGTLPYYIHLLDRVAGSAHFEVTESQARKIVGQLAGIRPGYLVPKLAVEVPGAASKREIAPDYLI